MEAMYFRKGFFESSKRFEFRVNVFMKFMSEEYKTYKLHGICASDKYIILYYDTQEEQTEEEKQPIITGFKK